MSRYSGRYYRGAAHDTRQAKREQAQARARSAEVKLLQDIFATDSSETGINGYPLRDQ